MCPDYIQYIHHCAKIWDIKLHNNNCFIIDTIHNIKRGPEVRKPTSVKRSRRKHHREKDIGTGTPKIGC